MKTKIIKANKRNMTELLWGTINALTYVLLAQLHKHHITTMHTTSSGCFKTW